MRHPYPLARVLLRWRAAHVASGLYLESEKLIKRAMTLIYLIHEVLGRIYEQIELPEWKI